MIEQTRGCGQRSMGGMYIEGTGLSVPCDRLPYPIDLCPVCEQGIKFSRGFTWIHWFKFAGYHNDECECRPRCPICHPKDTREKIIQKNEKTEKQTIKVRHGLMWVGKKYYTPESFITESNKMGICKKIATIPREIEYGKTWILLTHPEAGEKVADDGIEKIPAVFYAFKPTRVIKIISPKEVKDKKISEKLLKRGITPIVGIDDGKGNAKETFELDEWKNKGFFEKLLR